MKRSPVREKGMNYDGPRSSCNVGLCTSGQGGAKRPASHRWQRTTHRPGADLKESSWERSREGLERLADELLNAMLGLLIVDRNDFRSFRRVLTRR